MENLKKAIAAIELEQQNSIQLFADLVNNPRAGADSSITFTALGSAHGVKTCLGILREVLAHAEDMQQ